MRLNEKAKTDKTIQEIDATDITKTIGKYVRWTRYVHNISALSTARLINQSNKSRKITYATISAWENFKARATIEGLCAFADVFGISILWLIGRTRYPYDKENLLRLEWELFTRKKNNIYIYRKINGKNVRIFPPKNFPEILPQYKDFELREKYYSPEVRGNIIFALHNYIYDYFHNPKFCEEHQLTDEELSDEEYLFYEETLEEEALMSIYHTSAPLAVLKYYLTTVRQSYTKETFKGFNNYNSAVYNLYHSAPWPDYDILNGLQYVFYSGGHRADQGTL